MNKVFIYSFCNMMANITSMGNSPYRMDINLNGYNMIMDKMRKENNIILLSSLSLDDKKQRIDENIKNYEIDYQKIKDSNEAFFVNSSLGSLYGSVFYICSFIFLLFSTLFISQYFIILFLAFYIFQMINFYYITSGKYKFD